jgi:hypothetical protein
MPSFWTRFFGSDSSPKPADAGLPRTYHADPEDQRLPRARVFEPALIQYTKAVRLGDPGFENLELAHRWHGARARAMDLLLGIVLASPWADALVLRGSRLLKVWLGDEARAPGDLDWVVQPAARQLASAWADDLFRDLLDRAARHGKNESVELVTSSAVTDDIWTYDRNPGRRMVIPWRSAGVPDGAVQMDFTFGEELWLPAEKTPIPLLTGDTATAWTASKAQSLAWKLMWLENDIHPQGKDLYDATLLAEQTRLPPDQLQRALADRSGVPLNVEAVVMGLRVDWENFQREYPGMEGDATPWLRRLAAALKTS